jgi:hypothetical protein
MKLRRTPFFEEIRLRLKEVATPDERVSVLIWLLVNFTDDGHVRSPSGVRRRTIVLDDLIYWLVLQPRASPEKEPGLSRPQKSPD